MAANGISPTKIAMWLKRETRIRLSVWQVRNVVYNQGPIESAHSETLELETCMRKINGASYVLEEERDEVHVRTAIATFTKDELQNLSEFGDVIALDATFVPLKLNWNVIPITVVGRGREIRSGGLVMCVSVNANVFEWILKLLTERLPCREQIKTIISDDDVALRSAFANTESASIQNLGRVVCFWHKMQSFETILKQCRLDSNQMIQYRNIFRRLGMTRDPAECERCEDFFMCNAPQQLQGFLCTSVFPRDSFALCTKSHNEAWSLGYNTSSIAEAANSRLKRYCSSKNQSLVDLRQVAIDIEDQIHVNAEYLKARKPHKSDDTEVDTFMKEFHVHRQIAEALLGSYDKGGLLSAELTDQKGVYEINEPDIFHTDDKPSYSRYLVNICERRCSCRKVETVGLPCSHLMCLMRSCDVVKEEMPRLIHPRWIEQDETRINLELQFIPDVVEVDPTVKCLTKRQRYNHLNQFARAIAALGCGSKHEYKMALGVLNDLMQRLTPADCNEADQIADARGIRAGRPARKRIRSDQPVDPPKQAISMKACRICGGNHEILRCPHLAEVKRLAGPGKVHTTGGHKCRCCGASGHNVASCPAIEKYHQLREKQGDRESSTEHSEASLHHAGKEISDCDSDMYGLESESDSWSGESDAEVTDSDWN
jgi:hypothetical protein